MSPRIGEQTDIRRVWSCTYSRGGTVERQTLLQGKSRLSPPARQGGADRGAAAVLPESGRGIRSPSPGYRHGHGESRSRLIRRPRVPKPSIKVPALEAGAATASWRYAAWEARRL